MHRKKLTAKFIAVNRQLMEIIAKFQRINHLFAVTNTLLHSMFFPISKVSWINFKLLFQLLTINGNCQPCLPHLTLRKCISKKKINEMNWNKSIGIAHTECEIWSKRLVFDFELRFFFIQVQFLFSLENIPKDGVWDLVVNRFLIWQLKLLTHDVLIVCLHFS